MIISMHGNWTISVKSKEAAYPQRFVIAGAFTGNGSHDVTGSTAPIAVTGNQWSIAILNDPGNGFRLSDTRIKFPVISGGNFVFDIESNDAGSDKDFNDLILTCTSPVSVTDYMMYGNVTLYSNTCIINPCFRRWVVIDRYATYLEAIKIDELKAAIEVLYPERVVPVNPNPPDPAPFFTPMMINIADEIELPQKKWDVFRRIDNGQQASSKKAAARVPSAELMSNFNLEKTLTKNEKTLAIAS